MSRWVGGLGRRRPTWREPTPPTVEAMFMESRTSGEPMPAMGSERAARVSRWAGAGRLERGPRVRLRGRWTAWSELGGSPIRVNSSSPMCPAA
jgi:hypothetical protein